MVTDKGACSFPVQLFVYGYGVSLYTHAPKYMCVFMYQSMCIFMLKSMSMLYITLALRFDKK